MDKLVGEKGRGECACEKEKNEPEGGAVTTPGFQRIVHNTTVKRDTGGEERNPTN